MEDRRAAFPTHDEPHHNILDGPNMPTHSDPINVVHKRYWALLAVAVVGIGLFSFYSPVRMVAALHCSAEKPNFSYALVHDAAAPVSPEAALPSLQRHQTHCKRPGLTIYCSRTPYLNPALL